MEEPAITDDIIARARDELRYDPDKLNVVFAGNVNVGKSSLINAIRNKRFDDEDFAPVGPNQVTLDRVRYEDPIHQDVVLYDTPGAGTQDVRAFGYYYDQRLFAFDIVVLVHETTLTEVYFVFI